MAAGVWGADSTGFGPSYSPAPRTSTGGRVWRQSTVTRVSCPVDPAADSATRLSLGTARDSTIASYAVSYHIAQCKKPHTIGKTLIKPCMLDCAPIVLGKPAGQKFQDLPSNYTVKRRIDDIAANIEEKVVAKIKASPFWAIQLDESTDFASFSQLLVYGRYVHDTSIEEEFLFCQPLLKTTSARDALKIVENFLEKAKLGWEKLISVCTDGASAMLGCRSSFVKQIKQKNPDIEGVQCFIHCEALASKTLPQALKSNLDVNIKVVNYIKESALNTKLFSALCFENDVVFTTLLFHSEVVVQGKHVRQAF
ncbi:protein FAM200C-like [Watersipora subatra]|uniref:protein FAM200C-like n=1 Tax=Watersipora subatra TaxID=2589382 RepID=UPI00355BD050